MIMRIPTSIQGARWGRKGKSEWEQLIIKLLVFFSFFKSLCVPMMIPEKNMVILMDVQQLQYKR